MSTPFDRLPPEGSWHRGLHRGAPGATVPPDTHLSFRINIDNDGFQTVTLRRFKEKATLADVAYEIELAVQSLIPIQSKTSIVSFAYFTCSLETQGDQVRLVLESGTNTSVGTECPKSSVLIGDAEENNAATYLKIGETNGGKSEGAFGPGPPTNDELIKSLIAGLDWKPEAPDKPKRRRYTR
jgi:hypothetical protein